MTHPEAVEAVAKALAASCGLDLDNLTTWRTNWLDDGRVAVDALLAAGWRPPLDPNQTVWVLPESERVRLIAHHCAEERAKTAEDIARAIEHVCQCAHEPDPAIVEGCEYRRAAAIAREHGEATT